MPLCFLHKMQCLESEQLFLGRRLEKDTIFLQLELLGCALTYLVACSFSIGKTSSMCSRALRSLQTLWGTVSLVRSYWAYQVPRHIQKMWLTRSWSSNGPSLFVSLVTQGRVRVPGKCKVARVSAKTAEWVLNWVSSNSCWCNTFWSQCHCRKL